MSLFLLQTLPLEMLNVYFPHFLLSAFLNFYKKEPSLLCTRLLHTVEGALSGGGNATFRW